MLSQLNKLTPRQKTALAEAARLAIERRKLESYHPYQKQADFHAAGALTRERLLMAGNQVGKTLSASMEAAMHATGLYPDWWAGRRFKGPTVGWAAGVTAQTTRDNVQRMLLGRPGQKGTGALPPATIIATPPARGLPEQVDMIRVRHVSGRESVIALKSYEQGREKWQGETLDWVWFDEEPSLAIYTEGLTRTNTTGGCVWLSFTPLLGMSDVVRRFLMEKSPDRHVTQMTIDDALHYTAAERARIIASYPEHEREARAKGIPILGSGRVYPVAEERIREQAVALPDHWPRICGLDFGWDHPTAAVWLAWDRDTDTIHLYDCYRVREGTVGLHASALRARGDWIPVAWPHDGLQHDKKSGETLAALYRKEGVNMTPGRATFPDGGNGVEAGVMALLDRMYAGQFKVAAHLTDWWEEFRLYHRQDGKIVKEGDDLMAATRYAVMMLRAAEAKSGGGYSIGASSPSSAGSWMGF